MTMELKTYSIQELSIGQCECYNVKITEKAILEFCQLTGDFHPLHSDLKYARECGFKNIIAHGMLVTSYSSALIGMRLPGQNTIVIKEVFDYLHPVYPEDLILISGVVESIEMRFKTVNIGVTIKVKNQIVAKGMYLAKIRE
jgi:acyl dehydratase